MLTVPNFSKKKIPIRIEWQLPWQQIHPRY